MYKFRAEKFKGKVIVKNSLGDFFMLPRAEAKAKAGFFPFLI